ncbi:GMC family oxidoreductase [Microbacterium soli]|uniref:GMC family oxidoreductase n=1 Tax=Microbacterium soli TaxID=446075 RepID=A0ABP7MT58_9MICO
MSHPTAATRPVTVDPPVDVCIVGAGPSGAVTAKRLHEAGLRACVLERGDWPDRSNSRGGHDDFELRQDKDWQWNPNLRRSAADYPIDDADSDVAALMWNGVGGSAVVYASQWMRNAPSDFRVRSLDGVGDDWPMTYEDLVPFYEQVEADFGISGLDGDPAYPDARGYPMPPVPLGPGGRKVAEAMNGLGWHWWPGTNAIATRPYRHLSPSVQRGDCMWGSADNSKCTVDVTHWPDLVAAGVQLRTRARATRVMTDGDGAASGVEYIARDGALHAQPARAVILCANGVGTPRLLLMSASAEHPDGLANSSGLVGRRLMMHPASAVIGLFDEDLGTERGSWGQCLYSLEFYESDPSRGFIRGAKWGLQPTGGPQRVTGAYPWTMTSIWGEDFHRQLRRRLGRSMLWVSCGEDLPEESNRVELDPNATDDDGLPAARLVYRTSENSHRMLDWHNERMSEALRAAGATEIIIAPQIRESGWHLLGTAVMGTDARRSVVDPWGQAHDVRGLHIFDGSIWPTSSGMNPTATIAALALRCADHLAARMTKGARDE